ncbi:MAG: hypothetical protein H0X25_22345 [Acidobacteriales bacterium]|nr:hypothetical protein [Terriglobales bacterium]
MLATAAPSFLAIPWAANAGPGYIRAIPTSSQIGTTNGAASLNDGFPPLNFTPVSTGGVPPSGADMNGILNLVTSNIQWHQAGGWYQFNSAFATSIGGYPAKAILAASDGSGFYYSTADNNAANPDAGGAGWTRMGALSCPWSGLTGTAPPVSHFSNDIGYVTAAGASVAAPVQAVNGLSGYVSVPTGLSVNSIGYTVLYVVPGGGSLGSEGSLTTISGRPGTWMNSGSGNLASDQLTLLVRVA